MRTKRVKRVGPMGMALASLIFSQLPVDGQSRRSGSRERPAAGTQRTELPPVSRVEDSRPNSKPVMLTSSPKSQKMAAPFRSGKLPEPLRKPPGTPDEVAATLAKQVAAGDDQSVAALATAILTAGFGVRDEDGAVTQTVSPGQGLVISAWEVAVAAAAKMYGEGRTVTLAEFCDELKLIPALKQAPLDTILPEGVRAHARDDRSPLRFWARFIVELGRQADEPYDLLAGADAKSFRLDAIQSALILRRLFGDFYGFAQRGKQASAGFSKNNFRVASARWTKADERWQSQLFIRTAMRPGASPQIMKAQAAESTNMLQQASPCGALGEGDASTILDAAATILTTGWGNLLDYVGAEKYAAFLNVANILLVYAKFIATYAALETEISVDNPPLVRTKNATAGQCRQLTAKVTMNTGKWENINCFRTALNVATGLDMSLITDGPLKDVEVNWHLKEGGDNNNKQIVGFWNGGPGIQDAGTYAGIPGQKGLAVGNATRSKTDKNGMAQVYLQGTPQKNFNYYVLPVMKQAIVRTTIKMKGGDIKGDAVDIAGQALGGVGGLITMPTELLYRTDWASTGTVTVPVKDWKPCDSGAWYGTITYKRTRKWEGSGEKANNKSYWKEEEIYTANIRLDGKKDANGAPLAHVNAQASELKERGGTGSGACYRVSRQLHQVSGSASEATTAFSISANPRSGRYSVSPPAIIVPASGTYTVTSEVKGVCRNPYNRNLNQNDPVKDYNLSPGGPDVEVEGVIDPNNPYVLDGSKTVTVPAPGGGEIQVIVTWHLTRCGESETVPQQTCQKPAR
ncbi:MAG: hypothetical protein H0T77_07310 [Pyrinomonadaceae bacterium]|nr:hypothetical protein [Pyrinomonadaceae bacterium]